MMMIMCTINHCSAKIGETGYALNVFFSTDTVGQPYLREVAHEQTVIAMIRSAKPVISRVFILNGFFV